MKNTIKEITVISGKGGTGKTSIVGSLAYLAKNKIMVDCDVDAADLHLLLGGKTRSSNYFVGGKKAEIVADSCISCGTCTEYCRFGAINEKIENNNITYNIDKLSCEGCGVCAKFCPNEAIEMKDHISGQWYINETKYGPLIHAKLGIAEANSGRLVSLLRKSALEKALINNFETILIDGSPGIGCPVIASLTGVSYALIVTEPTVSAIHDMKRLIELTQHFNIKTGICINKYDINLKLSDSIEEFAQNKQIQVLSKIPYDAGITKAQIKGVPYLEYTQNGISKNIYTLWENLKKGITNQPNKEIKNLTENIQLDNLIK